MRVFIEGTPTGSYVISGDDGAHIARSLRMKAGESLTLCNGQGLDFECTITEINGSDVTVSIDSEHESKGEPSVRVTLYQALPKLDKMDFICQKSVESGVTDIVPMLSERCISRPDKKSADKKRVRWQKIAEEAAKQCGRGIIPKVHELVSFKEAIKQASGEIIFFYEGGGSSLRELINDETRDLSIFIGSEGGFDISEVELAIEHGAKTATMGPRIFRCETASTAALSAIMVLSGNMD